MTKSMNTLAAAVAILGSLAFVHRASADASITTFDNFTSDALYASWGSATIASTPSNYVITATGYGSNYKWIGWPLITGGGNTNIQLDVTLSGPPEADGQLGPIIDLLDADGTQYSYRWYGQTLGHHVLNMPIESPTAVVAAGTTPGLDLTQLQHMHMQLDPGNFGTTGAYTIEWNDLQLTGAPPFKITSVSCNPATYEVTLTWNSLPGKTYTILVAFDMANGFSPILDHIPSGGNTTTVTVPLPTGTEISFLQIKLE